MSKGNEHMTRSNLIEMKVNRTRAGYKPHTVRTKVRTLPDLPTGLPALAAASRSRLAPNPLASRPRSSLRGRP